MTILLNTTHVRKPSPAAYLSGASELFNLSGTTSRHFVFGRTAFEVDCNAINNDWDTVAGDLSEVFETWQNDQ